MNTRRLRDLAAHLAAGMSAEVVRKRGGGVEPREIEHRIALDVLAKLRRAWVRLSARERGKAGLAWAQNVIATEIADNAWRAVRKRDRLAVEAREKGMSVEEKRRRARNRRKAVRA